MTLGLQESYPQLQAVFQETRATAAPPGGLWPTLTGFPSISETMCMCPPSSCTHACRQRAHFWELTAGNTEHIFTRTLGQHFTCAMSWSVLITNLPSRHSYHASHRWGDWSWAKRHPEGHTASENRPDSNRIWGAPGVVLTATLCKNLEPRRRPPPIATPG